MKNNEIFKVIDLEQGTPEWLSFRRCHITATDISKIMGRSKWGTALDVYKDKMGAAQKPVNAAMQAGIDNEPIARLLLSEQDGRTYKPAVLESKIVPFIAASMDAVNFENGRHGGEIKCVGKKTFDRAWLGDIDESYRIQCQVQMFVEGLDEIPLFFMLVDPSVKPEEQQTTTVYINRDAQFIEEMIQAAELFWEEHILKEIPPNSMMRDVERRDNVFENQLALKWLEMKEIKDKADKDLKSVEEQLKELCEGKSVHYTQARVKVTQINRKGAVDMDKVCKNWKIEKLELEKYRKKNSSYVKITSEI